MYRVLVAGLLHEANTFAAGLTDLEAFRRHGLYGGGEVLTSPRAEGHEIGGVRAVAEAEGIELIPVVDAYVGAAPPASDAAYEFFRGRILGAARAHAGDIQGVMLNLHGAMASESVDDAEGELVAAVRAAVGHRVPIATTYDMHCHFTQRKASAADIVVGYHTAPHVDFVDTGARAMRILARAMRGEVKPVVAYRKLPMISPAERHVTAHPPASEVMRHIAQIEQTPGVLAATYFAAQPWLDVPELGWATVVVTDGDRDLAQAKADDLARFCWERREQYLVHKPSIREAIETALAAEGRPFVLADTSDSIAGGGYGDGNCLLGELLAMGYADTALLTVTDPAAVAACFAAGVGAELTLPLGGGRNPRFFRPIQATGRVKTLTDGRYRAELPAGMADIGRTAVLEVGDIHVLLSEHPASSVDAEAYRMAGLEPRRYKIVQVKSSIHFHAIYGSFAAGILALDAPGPTDSELTRLAYTRIPRPMWPFDRDITEPW
ncbi:MAG: M81 family metallopeptidase [Chloroflexota bacterium]